MKMKNLVKGEGREELVPIYPCKETQAITLYLSVKSAGVEEDGGLLEGDGALRARHAGQTVVPT